MVRRIIVKGFGVQRIWLEGREDAHLLQRTPPTSTSPREAISTGH